MPQFQVDYNYKMQEYSTFTTEADDADQAEQFTQEYVMETFPDATDMVIEGVREVLN